MIKEVDLQPLEKKVIRKALGIQLRSLYGILNGDIETDITLYCIQKDISKDEFFNEIQKDIEYYQSIIKSPSSFIEMEKDCISILKHILFNFLKNKKYKAAKSNIWRKINIAEEFLYSPN